MSNSYIWLRDRPLSGATTLAPSQHVSNGNEGDFSAFPKDPALLESHYQTVLSYPGHSLMGGGFTLCSYCILQPQSVGLSQCEY